MNVHRHVTVYVHIKSHIKSHVNLQVIFPEANRADYEELSPDLKTGLSAHFVSHYDEVFRLALEYDKEEQHAQHSAASSA